MAMTFLPIVERELRIASRRPATYWTRFFAALSVMALWLFLLGVNRSVSVAQLSRVLFIAPGVLALGFAMLAGTFLTADCLSEEKREETLGLLFLTDLRGYDVVLGKLAATSLPAVYGLLAIFPMLGLPVLMGGVSGGAFWRMALVLVVTLFLSLSLGMFISALNREARQAMAGTLGGMLLLAGISPALYWLQIVLFHRTWTHLFLLPSPGFAFVSALDSYYATRTGGRMFWASLQVLGWLGLGFLVLAAILLPRAWQEKNHSPKAGAGPKELRQAGSNASKPKVPCGPGPESDLFLWLAARKPAPGRFGRGLATVIFGVWLTFLVVSIEGTSHVQAFIVALFSAFALHVVIKCLVAIEASRQLSEDRRSGALELLLVSPLKEAQIVAGQALALKRHFGWWVALLVAVNLCTSGTTIVFAERLQINRGADLAIFQELFLGGILALMADFKALGTVGMWMALRANRHHRAVLGTLGRVLVPPWAGIFVAYFLLRSSRGSPDAAATMFACWFILGFIVDAVMAFNAQANLRRGFRSILAGAEPVH